MAYNMKVRAKVRKIGNSLGVIIPRDEATRHGLAEGDAVEIEVERRSSFKELFGSAKFSRSAQKIKDEAREGWGE